MARRVFTVDRHKEIERRLAEGRGLREIARALKCSRRTVREVRDGMRASPDHPRPSADPLWMAQLDWPQIIHELGLGHPLTFIWEERAQSLTSYPNFWKQFYRKFPQYRAASVTAREFAPGERVEVDYAGDTLEWVDLKSGEIHPAYVFFSGLGFQSTALCLGGGRHEKSQLARQSSAYVRLLRRRVARDRAGLLEAGRAEVPPLRSGSEPCLCAARRALLHGGRSGARGSSKGQGDLRRPGQNPDALCAVSLSAPAFHLARGDQSRAC